VRQYQKHALGILEEFLLVSATDREQGNLLELMEYCCGQFSTIICSQFTPEGWHKKYRQKEVDLCTDFKQFDMATCVKYEDGKIRLCFTGDIDSVGEKFYNSFRRDCLLVFTNIFIELESTLLGKP